MFQAFLFDETAQGLVEYALVISLLSLAAVAAMKLVGKKTSDTLSDTARFLK